MKDKERKSGLCLKGQLTDIAHYLDGSPSEVLQVLDNLVVDTGLGLTLGALGNIESLGIRTMQVGEGLVEWDIELPPPEVGDTELVTPLDEKVVVCHYWDDVEEVFSLTPTDILDVRTTFLSEEGNGTLREFGLRGGDSGTVLFNYVTHSKIVKTSDFNLERILKITIERTS